MVFHGLMEDGRKQNDVYLDCICLHSKEIQQLFFSTSDKVAAQSEFSAPKNAGICSIEPHLLLPPVTTGVAK